PWPQINRRTHFKKPAMSIAVRKRGGNRGVRLPGVWHSHSHQLGRKVLASFDIDSIQCPCHTLQMGGYGPNFNPKNAPNGIQGSARPEAKRYSGVGLQSLQNKFFGPLHGITCHRFDVGGSRTTLSARC
ncbi:MAG TPA: hypothetical protein PL065_20755, partial [Polyangiaceae bacterium]|nr:hypothetical protein [Polyangiaceae bacterium]